MRKDYRTKEAQEYRKLYATTFWRKRRKQQLADYPWCSHCERMGYVAVATVVNHVVPHKGDHELFYNGELASVCKPCHDGPIQSDERRGFNSEVDVDGYPISPDHPSNCR